MDSQNRSPRIAIKKSEESPFATGVVAAQWCKTGRS